MFRVESIFQNVHWLPGSMPSDVWRDPDIANAFIFEHNSDVYLVDSGVGPEFRQALSRFFAAKHYDSATLINTHMHTDHVCNNDFLNEINASEKHHLIHPAGVVSMLADGHHHRLFNGANEILPLLDNLIATHERRRSVIVKIAEQLSSNSIESIRSALVAEDAEFAQMAREKEFPREICFTRAMIAVAMREGIA